ITRRGHRVTMFSPCPRPADALYDHTSVPVGNSMRTFRFAWNLRRVGLEQYDIIHAHGDDYWLWDKDLPPHVRTMHGSCFAEARHVPRLTEKLRMTMLGASEVLATLVADRTICVSGNTRRYYPWVDDVIPNGVDLDSFSPGAVKEAEPTILFVGTYNNRKRGKLLMKHFLEHIRPALPTARLWMVCDDAPEAPGVTCFGRIDKDSLADLYRRAWVFCLPSSYEGFGVPYIEAMASGPPVVATPNAGAKEVLDGGRYGALVEPEQLGGVLLGLLTDDMRRQQLSKRGLIRAREYGWDRIVDEYETVYLSIRRGKSPARSLGSIA
ncbi:MAG TPA: glycosyltransferase family 4 protein, partial [Humisphaera sp.]|nr:glycosyltransferase family 4 protein [Humisphaera sp.]